MSILEAAGEQRALLQSIQWSTYLQLAEESDRSGGLLTYDQGTLEIMTPSMPHESYGSLLARMIEVFTLIRNIDVRTVASTTFNRIDLLRGFEADESYYIQNAPLVQGVREVDLSIHPPPDLVVEIEITKSAIDKLALFAAMGVPEVWRFNGSQLWMGSQIGVGYISIIESGVLPGFPTDLAKEILALQYQLSETELIRRFMRESQVDNGQGASC